MHRPRAEVGALDPTAAPQVVRRRDRGSASSPSSAAITSSTVGHRGARRRPACRRSSATQPAARRPADRPRSAGGRPRERASSAAATRSDDAIHACPTPRCRCRVRPRRSPRVERDMLTIDQATYDAHRRARQAGPPRRGVRHRRRARGQRPAPSGWSRWSTRPGSPTFYEFDSTELLAALQGDGARDEEPVVVYHSHTATEAYPSRTDIGLASEPGRPLRAGQHARARE